MRVNSRQDSQNGQIFGALFAKSTPPWKKRALQPVVAVVTNFISAIDDFFLLELIISWPPMHLCSSPEYIGVTYPQQNDTLLILTLLRDSHFLLDWWGPNVPIRPIIILLGEGKSVFHKEKQKNNKIIQTFICTPCLISGGCFLLSKWWKWCWSVMKVSYEQVLSIKQHIAMPYFSVLGILKV